MTLTKGHAEGAGGGRMTVWVLLSKSYYDDPVLDDIFATKELADKALADFASTLPPGDVTGYHVEEYEVIDR